MPTLNEILNWPDRYEAFYWLIDYYRAASASERENIRKSWNFNKKWNCPSYKTLTFSLPGERSCEEKIRAVLILYSIDNFKIIDYRDTLMSFCSTYHCAKEVGLDPKKLFEEVAEISSPEFAEELRNFINRDEEDKSLEAFGFKRIVESNGRVYFEMDLEFENLND